MFSPARSARIAAIINASTCSGTISIRMRARTHYVQRSVYRKSGYLCGNIIYANYASSCEGA